MGSRFTSRHTAAPRSGFTLVELLIVVVILGILSTVAVFAVHGITAKAEESSCSADRTTLEVALATYSATVAPGTVVNEDDVLRMGLLRAPSEYFDIVANQIVPIPGNVAHCA